MPMHATKTTTTTAQTSWSMQPSHLQKHCAGAWHIKSSTKPAQKCANILTSFPFLVWQRAGGGRGGGTYVVEKGGRSCNCCSCLVCILLQQLVTNNNSNNNSPGRWRFSNYSPPSPCRSFY